MVEVLVKDEENNLLNAIRENVTLADKDMQDYSALLMALEKAKGMGADHVTLFINNLALYNRLNTPAACCDEALQDFHQEAERLINHFESVTVKLKDEDSELPEFHA